MKRAELERKLRKLGWTFARHGGAHDIWQSSDGKSTQPIPRHDEINEWTARGILKAVRAYEESNS